MKKYKAIITDFDLTLADTAALIEDCLYENAARFGYDLDRRILRDGIGMTAESIYLDAGCSAPEAKRLHDEYILYSADIMRERTELYPGVAEGLAALHAKGIILAVLSLKYSDQIWRPLELAGVDKYIDSVISPEEVAAHKPEPDGIFYLSEKTGIALCDILYVGDSVTDMKTAINAGVDFAAVCTGAVTPESFAEMGAGMVYSTFADMCDDLSTLFASN